MSALGCTARQAGRAVALSAVALAFLVSSVLLLTLAAFFLLEPFYGKGVTLLVLGLVHLALAAGVAAAVSIGHGRHRDTTAPTAAPVDAHPLTGVAAAFFAGLGQGVAAGTRTRGAGHTQ